MGSCLIAVLLSVATPVGVAFAQRSPGDIAQARQLFNQGLRLRDEGDTSGALEKLRAAHALGNTPITGLELGRTYVALGRLVQARETFLAVARIAVLPQETARSTAARKDCEQLAEGLRGRIATLTLRIVGVPLESVTVTIDGETLAREALAAPRLVDPGTHDISVRSSPGGGSSATNLELKEGEARDVELRIAPAAGAAAVSTAASPAVTDAIREAPPAHPGQVQRVTGLVLAGAGVAALGAGGVFALVAKSQFDDAGRESFPAKHDDSASASRLADVATVMAGVGAAAAIAGGILWFTAPRADVSVGASERQITFRVRF